MAIARAVLTRADEWVITELRDAAKAGDVVRIARLAALLSAYFDEVLSAV